jgi:hypothetical protein
MSSAMGSKTYAAGFIGASLKGLNPMVQEDFFIQVSYSTSKAALTMSAIVSTLLHASVPRSRSWPEC